MPRLFECPDTREFFRYYRNRADRNIAEAKAAGKPLRLWFGVVTEQQINSRFKVTYKNFKHGEVAKALEECGFKPIVRKIDEKTSGCAFKPTRGQIREVEESLEPTRGQIREVEESLEEAAAKMQMAVAVRKCTDTHTLPELQALAKSLSIPTWGTPKMLCEKLIQQRAFGGPRV